MNTGRNVWDSADAFESRGGARSVNAMRSYTLAKMVAEAESAWLTSDATKAVEHIRELQAHCEKMILGLAPDAAVNPALPTAA